MKITRRSFLAGAASAAAGCAIPKAGARHRSDYEGIQIGAITYSYRDMPLGVGSTLRDVLGSRLGTIELMGNDLERDLGAPFSEKLSWKLTKEERAAVSAWRRTVDFGKVREIRCRYEDAGVFVHAVKFGFLGSAGIADWKNDYCFRVAEAMGADVLTREIPDVKNFSAWKPEALRLKALVAKYGVKVAFHNHLQIDAKTYDGPLLGWCDGFGINFDIGHYTAANDDDPLAFVRKYHDRISTIHLKDRTTKAHGRQNLAFGKGDTPLAGLFALLKDEGWNYPCDIELEYAIPAGSNSVREIGVCNDYCRVHIRT